jgi:hypothetical protein
MGTGVVVVRVLEVPPGHSNPPYVYLGGKPRSEPRDSVTHNPPLQAMTLLRIKPVVEKSSRFPQPNWPMRDRTIDCNETRE